MNITTIEQKENRIALVECEELLIRDVQSALDLMASVNYNCNSSRIVLYKSAVTEDFFELSTCLAGEILQKFINYGVKLAIIGDYANYTSKSLRDFIYESNHGKDVFFVATKEEAVEILATAK
ncbi:hypothetical protein acsn021_14890 [Anaerocolumna cellulosilytica]|uniref:DUF4180 domain-containing protein n=1 Tax=Anaerocolumna cellulosilytica TaxID=433286 RepID=A0A6S6R3I4_9FIRM|nr:DUF4180 domain-containing protein [Anaerocolumna cellulosilytica]MBB5196656.1 hypothetical protein [Anaerocolumna cellulosilytica]BCJ93920.1 hypothetical protein acsn021_14890 [Anaerocolumna cellulosilytica]